MFQKANNKGTGQTLQKRRLVCTFVLRMQQSQYSRVKAFMCWPKYATFAFCVVPIPVHRERICSVVECLTRDRGSAGMSLTGVAVLCP